MLHRPYIRKDVRQEVEARAAKNEKGQFLDANTGKPIVGKYDLGHKTGHEFRTERSSAEKVGLTQGQFNDKMNTPDLYQIEDPSSNRSHKFEAKSPAETTQTNGNIQTNGNTETTGSTETTGNTEITGNTETTGNVQTAQESESSSPGQTGQNTSSETSTESESGGESLDDGEEEGQSM